MSLLLTATDLHKNYAGEHALSGVSFSVEKGKLFGLIGADGAGKSTLLRICTTLVAADKGQCTILGFDVKKDLRNLRASIGYMPQKFSLYQDLSVGENMQFFADLFGVKPAQRKERMARLLEFSRLAPFVNRRAKNLSGGMKQKLALSCTLIHTPQILFLDEPTTGVDPVSRKEFWTILSELRTQGITIVVSTPYMDEAHLCDELLFLHHGKIMQQGTPHNLLADYPLDLYKVSNPNAMLTISQSAALPAPIELMYPEGGAIHAAVPKTYDGDISACIKSIIPQAETIEKIEPKIEDLFIYLLTPHITRDTF
jgi:ABC-2 type transport system ATP-binding protein